MKARSRRVDGIKYSFNFNDYVVFFFCLHYYSSETSPRFFV